MPDCQDEVTDFDLNMLKAFDEVFVLRVRVFRDLTRCHGTELDPEPVCHTLEPVPALSGKTSEMRLQDGPDVGEVTQNDSVKLGIGPMVW